MNTKFSIFVVFLSVIFACSRTDKPDLPEAEEVISINPGSVSKEKVKYSAIFDSLNYIFIPTDSNFLIGKVDKLLVTDDYIFVMDQKMSRSVFGVNKKGDKLLHINKTGRGPGEYALMTDIAYNPKQRELLIYCKIRQCILHYSLDGKFLHEEKNPFKIRKFCPIEGCYAFHCEYYENNKLYKSGLSPNVILSDLQKALPLQVSAYFKPPVNQGLVLNTNCQFSAWEDTVSIKPDHNNIVYHITADKIIPKYRLDFGAYNMDERYWNMVRKDGAKYRDIKEFITESGLCESFWFLESSDYIYFSYKQKGERYDVLYSKNTKKIKHLRYYQNDMDKITLFYPKAIYKNKLYCLLKSEEVTKMQQVLPGELPDKLLKHVDEFDNPIIVEFTLKPF